MTSVNVFDFRNELAKYLDLVESGKSIVVKKFNRPVAMLSPYRKEKAGFEKFFGFMDKGLERGVEFEDRVRRNDRERKWTKRYARSS